MNKNNIFARENLFAWCIVPFDRKKRDSKERAEMMDRLGLKRLAYDYRDEHIPTFDREIETMKRHGIEIFAWWGASKETIEAIERNGIHPQIWYLGGDGTVESEASRLKPTALTAARLGLKVALYNHGGWFGEPENQIAIIEHLKKEGINNLGIVYNLHHGHSHLHRFAELLEIIKPYLLALNLNGMVHDGDSTGKKILPLGQGELDLLLLRIIRESGWVGPIGIINHTEEDAEMRLLENIEGLEWLLAQLDGDPSTPRPQTRT
jgi:sugar phosphate isomerase/epimerase